MHFVGKYKNIVDLAWLKLGITTREETKDLLGSPLREETLLEDDQIYDHYLYFYSAGKKERSRGKLFILEFKNNRLNAYMKLFTDQEVGKKNLEYFESNVYNKSNLIKPLQNYKKDVVNIFGIPPIKGYCDSKINVFKGICSDNLSEVWIYLNYSDNKTRKLYIEFNSEGQVIKYEKKVE